MRGERSWPRGASLVLAVVLSGFWASGGLAQTSATHPRPMGMQGSPNLHVLAHLPLGPKYSIADMEIDQDMSRPFAYVSRRVEEIGFDVISVEDPGNAEVIFKWRIENPELHTGGAMDAKTFKHEGRHYFVQATSFGSGRPDADVAAIVFDVTGLPDPSQVREVGRIRPEGAAGSTTSSSTSTPTGDRSSLPRTTGPRCSTWGGSSPATRTRDTSVRSEFRPPRAISPRRTTICTPLSTPPHSRTSSTPPVEAGITCSMSRAPMTRSCWSRSPVWRGSTGVTPSRRPRTAAMPSARPSGSTSPFAAST